MILLIRGLIYLVLAVAIGTCSFTVKLGDRTAVQHFRRIWSAEETQEMVHGVKEKAGPVVERVGRGVRAGVREAKDSDAAAEVGEAAEREGRELERRATDHAARKAGEAAEDAVRRRLDRDRDAP